MLAARNNPFIDLFNREIWPNIDTRPGRGGWRSYCPGDRSALYREDYAEFQGLGSDRHSFIRRAADQDELSPTGWDRTDIPPLEIWAVIVRIVPGWHLELPFWRGPEPSSVSLSTDAEVFAVFSECIATGGYNQKSLADWRAAIRNKVMDSKA